MKIACNSAYIQTETLNFTFAQQTIIVYFYLRSNFQEIAMPNINVQADYFAHNLGLYSNRQQKNQFGHLHTLNFYCC